MQPDKSAVLVYLRELQNKITSKINRLEVGAQFQADVWQRAAGGGGETRTIGGGQLLEKGGVAFSHVMGTGLPPSATQARPELAGARWEAMGVSLVFHPRNPHIPTTHMNVRFFIAEVDGQAPIWWFGGGFDLTPYYPYDEDVLHWHQIAERACSPYGADVYKKHKEHCDRYFLLTHRNETRGIGGIFFDDLNDGGFDQCFAFQRSVGDAFLEAYLPIVERRRQMAYTDRERQFQLYRRGRYVEFNLVLDRGTLFGLQSGGRTESILMSMPPLVRFDYNWQPEPGSAEARLYQDYLRPRDWLTELAHNV